MLHTLAVALTLPAGQAYPAVQLPLHAAVVTPDTFPNRPAGHSVHTDAPDSEYCPSGHTIAVALTLPAGQAYPALQLPLHAAVVIIVAPPYTPAGHREHDGAPLSAYCPVPHTLAVALTLPAGQAYPALQLPLHADVGNAAVPPYTPAGHSVQFADPASE